MKTPGKLFIRRLRDEIRFQFRAAGMVVDWTVLLYLVIPAIIAVVVIYVNWWTGLPAWIDGVPFLVPAAVLFLLLSSGEIRLFVEEADILFLRQTSWMRVLKRYGVIYSFIRDAFLTALAVALVLPFFVLHYGLSASEIASFYIFTLFVRVVLFFTYHFLSVRFHNFLLRLMKFVVIVGFAGAYLVSVGFLIGQPIGLGLLTMIPAVWVYFFAKNLLQKKGSFFADVEREEREHMKLVSLLFSQAAPVQKKSLFSRRRPYLFSKSQRLFKRSGPVYGLTAMHIKVFLRDRKMWLLYLQFTGLITGAVLFVPVWMKWLVWLAALLLMADWFRSFLKGNQKQSFSTLWRWKAIDQQQAAEKAMALLLLACALVSGFALGLSAYSLAVAHVMLFGAFFYTWLVAKTMTFIW